MFDKGRLPWGHMHSNPLQIALERGVPALPCLARFAVCLRATICERWRQTRLDWSSMEFCSGAVWWSFRFLFPGRFTTTGAIRSGDDFYFMMGLVLALNRRSLTIRGMKCRGSRTLYEKHETELLVTTYLGDNNFKRYYSEYPCLSLLNLFTTSTIFI